MTSNQLYGGLNRRFDKRAARLRSLGFIYERIDDYGIAVFTSRYVHQKKRRTIPASTVMHADNASWLIILSEKLTTGIRFSRIA